MTSDPGQLVSRMAIAPQRLRVRALTAYIAHSMHFGDKVEACLPFIGDSAQLMHAYCSPRVVGEAWMMPVMRSVLSEKVT